jgi:hypothetical protein
MKISNAGFTALVFIILIASAAKAQSDLSGKDWSLPKTESENRSY